MVDHRDGAARLRRVEQIASVTVFGIDPRQAELRALPISVVIDQMEQRRNHKLFGAKDSAVVGVE